MNIKISIYIQFIALLIITIIFSPLAHANTGEIITIDNLDDLATPQNYWATSGGASPYQTDSVYSLYSTFLWEADLPTEGEYIVEAYWTAWPNRSQEANYEITHANGSDNVIVNQQNYGAEWVELGRYQFNPGRYGVTLSNNDLTHSTINADAIRFIQVTEPSTTGIIEVDNLDYNVIRDGSWNTSAGVNPYEGNSEYSINSTFSWLPMIMQAGRYQVQAYWTNYPNRSDEAQYTINHAEGASTATVDQKIDSNRWVSLGTYQFNSGDAVISLTNGNNSSTINADAIRLIPAPAKANNMSENAAGDLASVFAQGNNSFGSGTNYPSVNLTFNNEDLIIWDEIDLRFCDIRCPTVGNYDLLTRLNDQYIVVASHLRGSSVAGSGNASRGLVGWMTILQHDDTGLTNIYTEEPAFYSDFQSLGSISMDPDFIFYEPTLLNDLHIDDEGHIYAEYNIPAVDSISEESYVLNYWIDDSLSPDDENYVVNSQTIRIDDL